MANKDSVWNHLKENWIINKYEIRDLNINPNKDWYQITLEELGILACHLDVLVSDMV